MIVDAFPFFDELDILEARLRYLNDTVDYFVIVEADTTHSGTPKPLNFAQNLQAFRPFADKILYVPVTYDEVSLATRKNVPDTPRVPDYETASWDREVFQRNQMMRVLKLFPEDTTVICSDVDEIPSKIGIQSASRFLPMLPKFPAVTLVQDQFTYNLQWREQEKWKGPVVTTKAWLDQYTPVNTRKNHLFTPIQNGGWHLTYWGGVFRINHKLNAFAHQEFNISDVNNLQHIGECIRDGKTLYDHHALVPVDKTTHFNTPENKEFFDIFEPLAVYI